MSIAQPQSRRSSIIDSLSGGDFDVVILGGGIHGATSFYELSRRGYRVALFEKKDFSWATSSRSSKLLHGGIRYLQQGNISLVAEALTERARLSEAFPFQTRPLEFVFPIVPSRTPSALIVQAGMWFYDSIPWVLSGFRSKTLFRSHRTLSQSDQTFAWLKELGVDCQKAFLYSDGQANDARLVMEFLLAGKKLGGVSLNYAEVNSLSSSSRDGGWKVGWEDALLKQQYQSTAQYVLNLTGPWCSKVDSMVGEWKPKWPTVVLSRGAHLIFDVPWPDKGLILPTGVKGRYYFVLPFLPSGGSQTLVGTTDDPVSVLDEDPQANEKEINELLDYLSRDLPNSGLNSDSLYSSFCGLRTLASRAKDPNSIRSSDISRSEEILFREKYALLVGGKYTTSWGVSAKICDAVERTLGSRDRLEAFGVFEKEEDDSALLKVELRNFLSELYEKSYLADSQLEQKVEKIVSRFGARALLLIEIERELSVSRSMQAEFLALDFLAAEYVLTCREEQVEGLSDFQRRIGEFWNEEKRVKAERLLERM